MMCNLIKENTLFVGDNKVTFQSNIKNIIEINDIVIVQIWNTSTGDIQKQPFNNIYAVNQDGCILWNIKDIIDADGIYTSISVDEFSQLIAIEFIGRHYVIDVNNRRVLDSRAFK